MDTENSSSLHIVLCDTLTHPQLATLLARQRAEEPNVKIQVHESSTSSISQKFSRGQYDIGISRSAIVNDRWKAVPLWREAWIVAASIHSSLGRESIVTPAHLMDFTIIHWDAVFRKASFLELDTILNCGTISIVGNRRAPFSQPVSNNNHLSDPSLQSGPWR